MGNRLLEELRNLPHPGYEWLSDRLQAPPAATDDIKVRLDGFFRLNYADVYTAAWQALFPRVRELAIPILYLQRHALELTIKDSIRSCLAIREAMHLGHDVFGLQAPGAPEAEAQITTGHKFDPLFNCLARNLEILKLPPPPPEYQRARELLEAVEDGDETRLRYETTKNGSWRSSFDFNPQQPKIADVGQIARLLTTIVNEHGRLGQDPRDEPESFIDHLAHLGVSVEDDIMFALQDLERRTKNDTVVWRLESTRGIEVDDDHPDLKALKKGVSSLCLITDYNARRMVVLVVAAHGDEPHMIGCVRDGKLSRLLWPPRYQSNVISAAIDSVKKHDPRAFCTGPA